MTPSKTPKPNPKTASPTMRCTVCNAAMGQCDCWTDCRCGWSYRKGGECRNPVHQSEKARPDLKSPSPAPGDREADVRVLIDAERAADESMRGASYGTAAVRISDAAAICDRLESPRSK